MSFTPREFSEACKEALLNSFRDNVDGLPILSVDDFYKEWFRGMSRPMFFLFKKNYNFTDIQFSEMLALIRCHTRNIDGEQTVSLNFLTSWKAIRGQAPNWKSG